MDTKLHLLQVVPCLQAMIYTLDLKKKKKNLLKYCNSGNLLLKELWCEFCMVILKLLSQR